jgi:hypothetical protein
MTRIGVWLLVLASLWFGSGSPGCVAAGDARPPGEAIWIFLITYGSPLLAYVVLRVLTVHVVLRLMMKHAAGSSDTDEPRAETPHAPARGDVRFLELDSTNGLLLSDTDQDLLERALDTGRRTLGIFWTSVTVFAVVSLLCFSVFSAVTAPPSDVGVEPIEPAQIGLAGAAWTAAGVLAGALIVLALVVLSVTVTTRYASIRRVPLLSSVTCAVLLFALAVVAGRALRVPWYLYLLPPTCSALLVLAGYAGIWRKARADGNIKLLILRVFGADRNTAFVFGPLMRSWRFLGAFFTIVDPSYIRYQFSLSSSETRWKLLRVLSLIGVLVGTFSWLQSVVFQFLPTTNPALAAWDELDREQQQRLLGMVAWLLLIPLAVFPVVGIVRTRFVRSASDLDRRIRGAEGRPVGWQGTFSGYALYCYDNVWKKAVSSLLRAADVVLMDLRGFSPTRSGCKYEIGKLIDDYPIQQVVFLVDRGDSQEAVHHIIREAWTERITASPNYGLESPTLRTFAPGNHAGRDIPRILALLVASAAKGGRSATAFVPVEERALRRDQSAGLERLGPLGVRAAEVLDTAIATPKYARVAIPLLLGAVAAMLYVSVQPLIHYYRAYSRPTIAELPAQSPALPSRATQPQGSAESVRVTSSATAHIAQSGGVARGRSYSNPLEVTVEFTGGLAAEALKWGHVKITRATVDGNEPLELLRIGDSFDDPEQTFLPIDRSAKDFFTQQLEHPPDGFRLTITYFKPAKAVTRLERLAGKLTLQIIDPEQVITMESVGSRLSGPGVIQLRHPKLDDIGQFSLTIPEANRARLVVKGLHMPDFDVRLVDALGRVAKASQTTTSIGDETTRAFDYAIDRRSLEHARLEILFGYKSFEAPFSFKDIAVQK